MFLTRNPMVLMQRDSRFLSLILRGGALALLLAVMACSSDDKNSLDSLDEGEALPAEQLYSEGQDGLALRDYKLAVERFEQVERQHPYSEWATRAQIMAAYANYQMEEYDEAILLLERFARLHPGNENVAYAYYLIALSYYEQIVDVGRDQSMTQRARTALTEVVRRFPDSDYARDAKLKLNLTTDHLAGKEMEIGRYYLKRGDIVSAINRFKYVLKHYQTTTHAAEALHRLTEAYMTLGITEEAKKYAAVLGYNYPGSEWYKDSYRLLVDDRYGQQASEEETRSFWQRFLPSGKE